MAHSVVPATRDGQASIWQCEANLTQIISAIQVWSENNRQRNGRVGEPGHYAHFKELGVNHEDTL